MEKRTEISSEVLTPNDSVYDIVHKFWQLPAVVLGIQLRFWDFAQNATNNEHIVQIWKDSGFYKDGKLTEAGLNIVKCEDLFTYEALMLQDQLFGKTNTTNPNHYVFLRRGLSEYAKIGIYAGLKFVTHNLKAGVNILDYCGGSGGYLECLLDHDPLATGCIVDKAITVSDEFLANKQLNAYLEIDFKDDPDWFRNDIGFIIAFDLVMLNEIMHCCSIEHQQYLIDSSCEMLAEGGHLLITEQTENPYLNWRLRTYTENGECSDQSVILEMLLTSGLTIVSVVACKNHWMILARL